MFDTISTKALEALAYALKGLNVAEIAVEEVQNCLLAIMARVNPPAPDAPLKASAVLSALSEQVVSKAVERLEAE
jgi:hypothetical protein